MRPVPLRARSTFLAYTLLLVALALPAFTFLGLVLNEYLNGLEGDEFTGNGSFLVVFGGPPLILGALATISLIALFRAGHAERSTLLGWAVTAIVIGAAASWFCGHMEWIPIGLGVGLLVFGLGGLVLVSTLAHRPVVRP